LGSLGGFAGQSLRAAVGFDGRHAKRAAAMIPSERADAHASLAVPKEIFALADVEMGILHVEYMPERATISFPELTDYVVGLVKALGHCSDRLISENLEML
jgi:hypothetical protein